MQWKRFSGEDVESIPDDIPNPTGHRPEQPSLFDPTVSLRVELGYFQMSLPN